MWVNAAAGAHSDIVVVEREGMGVGEKVAEIEERGEREKGEEGGDGREER